MTYRSYQTFYYLHKLHFASNTIYVVKTEFRQIFKNTLFNILVDKYKLYCLFICFICGKIMLLRTILLFFFLYLLTLMMLIN